MKRALLIILFTVSAFTQQNKITIAVMNLQAQSGVDQSRSQAITEMIRTEIVNTVSFRVVERSQVDEILAEQELQLSGCTENACAVKIGKLLSLSKIIVGSVSLYGEMDVINIRLIDVETGQTLLAENQVIENPAQVIKAVKELARKVEAKAMDEMIIKVKISDIENLMSKGLFEEAYRKLGIYKRQSGVNEQALELEKIIKLEMAHTKHKEAEKTLKLGNYGRAKQLIQEASRLDPDNKEHTALLKKIEDEKAKAVSKSSRKRPSKTRYRSRDDELKLGGIDFYTVIPFHLSSDLMSEYYGGRIGLGGSFILPLIENIGIYTRAETIPFNNELSEEKTGEIRSSFSSNLSEARNIATGTASVTEFYVHNGLRANYLIKNRADFYIMLGWNFYRFKETVLIDDESFTGVWKGNGLEIGTGIKLFVTPVLGFYIDGMFNLNKLKSGGDSDRSVKMNSLHLNIGISTGFFNLNMRK